jgi:histidinol-phosphate aminotransferase
VASPPKTLPGIPFSDVLRPELAELSAYAPHAGQFAIRLDANEAPPLLSAAARSRLAAVAAETAFCRYPDAGLEKLREGLAARSGVTPAEILPGVGSDELITLLLTALSQPRHGSDAVQVVTTTPTFVMYRMSAKVRGQRVLEVPLDEHWDLSETAMLSALRIAEPSVIFIASPNNPTSNQVSRERLARVIEAAPRSLVVIDEAYVDYSVENQLELYRRYENVAILRTLSKIGFAALRVGWLIARPEAVRELDKVRLPYNLPTLSQTLGALAVTELAPEIDATVRAVVAERNRLVERLAELPNLVVTPSQANFLWLRAERPAGELFEALSARGILVRSFHSRGGRLANQLRVTIGTPQENDAFFDAYRTLVR